MWPKLPKALKAVMENSHCLVWRIRRLKYNVTPGRNAWTLRLAILLIPYRNNSEIRFFSLEWKNIKVFHPFIPYISSDWKEGKNDPWPLPPSTFPSGYGNEFRNRVELVLNKNARLYVAQTALWNNLHIWSERRLLLLRSIVLLGLLRLLSNRRQPNESAPRRCVLSSGKVSGKLTMARWALEYWDAERVKLNTLAAL